MALVHGDLWGENLILNESLDNIVGVIDFESLALADIAQDFAPLSYFGGSFLNEVTTHYEALNGKLGANFHNRLQNSLILREISGLKYALEYPQSGELEDCLRKIHALPVLSS